MPNDRCLGILVVEDNVDAAELMVEVLAMLGHRVRSAGDGVEALNAVDEFTPDVAFIDLGLPDMDGFALADALRARPSCTHTKLFALTGHGSEADLRRSKDAGFEGHLLKPVGLDKIEAVLAACSRDRGE